MVGSVDFCLKVDDFILVLGVWILNFKLLEFGGVCCGSLDEIVKVFYFFVKFFIKCDSNV